MVTPAGARLRGDSSTPTAAGDHHILARRDAFDTLPTLCVTDYRSLSCLTLSAL